MKRLWTALGAALLAAALTAASMTGCAASEDPAALSAPAQTAQPTPRPLTLEEVRRTGFSDLSADAVYRDAAAYTACLGVLGGTAEGVWSPELYVDRAVAATALFRLEQVEERPYMAAFADVEPGAWYAPAVTWAVEEGILNGREDGLFHPYDPITRGELALVLYRYAGSLGMDLTAPEDTLENYWDGQRVPEMSRPALNWCLYSGLFAPLVSREVHPGYAVTRGQLAQVLTAWKAPTDPVAKSIYDAQLEAVASKSQAVHDQLGAEIEDIAKKYGAIGLQVAVIEGGRVTDSFVYGRANNSQTMVQDVETGTVLTVDTGAMTRDHKLRIASISKVVVAMNAMALAEDGKLDLEGSIGPYWNCQAQNRAYPDVPVSIRSILSHTSSIPLYGDGTSRRYADVRQRLANGKFSSLQPGSIHSWGYNNYAFGVLGMTLELSQNRRYDDIADEYFFLPLDMDAGVVPGELDHPELIADIYRHSGEVGRSAQAQREMRYTYDLGDYGNYFCGGLTISAVDVAKLWAVLAGDGAYEGQRLLSQASVAAMETSLGTPYGQEFEQCYPLRLQHDIYGRDSLYYHTGSAYGVFNLASYDPATGDGVVVLTTGASGAKDSRGIYTVCANISQAVYTALSRELVEYREPEPGQVAVEYVTVDSSGETAVEYVDENGGQVRALIKD